jgi:hypothetical protein
MERKNNDAIRGRMRGRRLEVIYGVISYFIYNNEVTPRRIHIPTHCIVSVQYITIH